HYSGNHDDGYTADPIDYTKIKPRNIRINLAVAHDMPLVGANDEDPNKSSLRRSANAPKFTYLAVAEELDYTEKLRIDSRFFGWARVNHALYAGFGDRATAGNELF